MQPRPDAYARRLLHRDPQGRYSAIVMTWGPGQGTAVHDHGGLWCVEGVVDGEIAVTQYLVQQETDGYYRVTPIGSLLAGTGSAGCLIPPTDHHVLANARPAKASVTLHVYGGDLDDCKVFLPATPDGRYAETTRMLSFTRVSTSATYIDLQFRGSPRVIATAILQGADGVTLIDPGPTSCLPALESGPARSRPDAARRADAAADAYPSRSRRRRRHDRRARARRAGLRA